MCAYVAIILGLSSFLSFKVMMMSLLWMIATTLLGMSRTSTSGLKITSISHVRCISYVLKCFEFTFVMRDVLEILLTLMILLLVLSFEGVCMLILWLSLMVLDY